MSAAVIGFTLVAFPVFAEELKTASPTNIRLMRQDTEQEMRERSMGIKTASSSSEMVSRREEFRQRFESRKEEVKKKFEDEKVRLGEKLKKIKDERKKEMVKKINEQFQELNTRKLEHFSSVLDQMEEVLVKIKARAARATIGSADMSVLNTKIAAFETAVTTARVAIVAQSAKVYSIEITTEGNLRNNTGVTRQALQGNLKTVFDLVKTAHESLKDIHKELASIRIVDREQKTSTASTTATTTSNQ